MKDLSEADRALIRVHRITEKEWSTLRDEVEEEKLLPILAEAGYIERGQFSYTYTPKAEARIRELGADRRFRRFLLDKLP